MSGVGGFGTSLLRLNVGETGNEGACRLDGETGAGGAFRIGGGGAGSCAGIEGSDLFIRRVISESTEATEYAEAVETTEYVLDGTREGTSFGGVGGTSSTCKEFLLNDRKEMFELYPLSVLASGFGG